MAGSSGLAPIKAILEQAAKRGDIPVLSEEPMESDWIGARGLVTEHIKDHPGIQVPFSKAYLKQGNRLFPMLTIVS